MKNDFHTTLRAPKSKEVDLALTEMREAPDIVYIDPNMWERLDTSFVVTSKGEFVGICSIFWISNNWAKIGPLFVMKKFRRLGVAKHLLEKVFKETKMVNTYIGTSNRFLKTQLERDGFSKIDSSLKLPKEVKLFFLRYGYYSFSRDFIFEYFRKMKTLQRDSYSHYIRKASFNN